MLSYVEKLSDKAIVNADICIIGAGAAGISIAREFIGSKLKIVLLESGNFEYDPDTQDLYDGDNVGREYFALNATRLRYFGGTTNHWGGQSGPLDELDFAIRDWVSLSGWPLSYKAIVPYYIRAQQVIEIKPFDYSTKYWEKTIRAKSFPLDSNVFVSSVRQFSPPTRFGKKYRQEIVDAKNINLVLNANAVELVVNESASLVTSVRVLSLSNGEFQVNAKKVILASGGLENPRLLLLSDAVQKSGLGNHNDQVGRYFMEHPHWLCGKILLANPETDVAYYDGIPIRRQAGIRAVGSIIPTNQVQKSERLLNTNFELEPHYDKTEEEEEDNGIGNKLGDFIDHLGGVIRRKNYTARNMFRTYFEEQKKVTYLDVTAMTEQAPNSESRVRLSKRLDALGQRRIELNWRLGSQEENDIERTSVLLANEIGRSGVGRMKVAIEPQPGWYGGNHHMGTTRMSNSEKHGVVDSNCKVFGIDNLYIAGSSVFPTGGAINPTFTIVALSLRLAEHLKREFYE